MKSAGFLVLLLVTVVFLWFAGAWHFERALRSQFHVGEATIPLPTAETVLSDDMVTQLVLFALASNSIPVSNWTFEPSLQHAPSVVTGFDRFKSRVRDADKSYGLFLWEEKSWRTKVARAR